MAEPMPITPEVVTWARRRAGYSVEAAKAKFRKIVEWEAGEAFPSYPQLEKMADKFKVPVAVFFFPEPPELPPVEETFRTLGPDQIAQIPPRIRYLFRKAQTFQMGLEELNDGQNPAKRLITRDLEFRPTDRIEQIAADVRKYLGVTTEQQFAWGGEATALDEWRQALLRVGVHFFKDAFREPDYFGFCLYDDEFPIIYLNSTAGKTRQTFTLFHELMHLLFHTSGVDLRGDSIVDELAGNARRIEVICNRVADRLMVPEETLVAEFAGRLPTEAVTAKMAAQQRAEHGELRNGVHRRSAKVDHLGTEYIRLAFRRFYQNRIDRDELANILDTKPKDLTRLEEQVLGSAT